MKAGQLPRTDVRKLRADSLAGDAHAARRLLAHSVASGHDRLALRRYVIARLLGAERLDEFGPFCTGVAARLAPSRLRSIVRDLARAHRREADIEALLAELVPQPAPESPSPLLSTGRSYRCAVSGVAPHFAAPPVFEGARSAVLGRATLGAGAVIGAGSVIRADGHFVTIGDDFVLGVQATVHIAHDVYPTIVGNGVAVGRNAIVHACTVGDRCAIGDNAVVLDGSVVEDDVLIERDSVVFPRSRLEAGTVYAGSPARPARKLAPGELARAVAAIREETMRHPGEESAAAGSGAQGGFVAATATVEGDVALEPGASVFFGCTVAAGDGRIVIGANTNVQDNSVLSGDVIIGADTTIGHNVTMEPCTVGANALIGMGAVLAAGTRVEDDVLVAAGSLTTPGQVLESGWLWGGRPAVRMKPLDEARRAMMRATITQYCLYAEQFRQPGGQG